MTGQGSLICLHCYLQPFILTRRTVQMCTVHHASLEGFPDWAKVAIPGSFFSLLGIESSYLITSLIKYGMYTYVIAVIAVFLLLLLDSISHVCLEKWIYEASFTHIKTSTAAERLKNRMACCIIDIQTDLLSYKHCGGHCLTEQTSTTLGFSSCHASEELMVISRQGHVASCPEPLGVTCQLWQCPPKL